MTGCGDSSDAAELGTVAEDQTEEGTLCDGKSAGSYCGESVRGTLNSVYRCSKSTGGASRKETCANGCEVVSAVARCVKEEPAELPPPTLLHWVVEGETARLVFSRSKSDENGRRLVEKYRVCTPLGCEFTERNYLEINRAELPASQVLDAKVASVGWTGKTGSDSPVCVVEDCPTVDLKKDPTTLAPATAQLRKAYAPVPGDLYVSEKVGTQAPNSTKTLGAWTFLQHKGGYHRAGSGLGSADDTYAWDANLNPEGAGWNCDQNAMFTSVGFGWAVPWKRRNTTTGKDDLEVLPGDDKWRAILLDHGGWYSGYLHANNAYVRSGDYVTPWTEVGTIGRSATDNEHLHFAIYEGENAVGKLKSVDVEFLLKDIRIELESPPTLVPYLSTVQISATVFFSLGTQDFEPSIALPATALTAQTGWKSTNTTYVTSKGKGVFAGIRKTPSTLTTKPALQVFFRGAKAEQLVEVQ